VGSGKGVVRIRSAFLKGKRRRKGEKERGRDRVPGKPRAREGCHNGHNGRLDARHADGERGKWGYYSMGSMMPPWPGSGEGIIYKYATRVEGVQWQSRKWKVKEEERECYERQ